MSKRQLETGDIKGYLDHDLKIKTKHGWDTMTTLSEDGVNTDHEDSYYFKDNNLKPILKPMTKEVLEEAVEDIFISKMLKKSGGIEPLRDLEFFKDVSSTAWFIFKQAQNISDCPNFVMNILHEYHVDYNNLIGEGLAIDETTLKTK